MGIVESVEDDERRPSDDLETSWSLHSSQTLLDDGGLERPGESLGRRNSLGSVVSHVFTEERKEQLPQRPGSSLNTQHLAAEGTAAVQQAPVGPLQQRLDAGVGALGKQDRRGFRLLASNDRSATWFDDSRLLGGNFIDGVAKDVHVVHGDRGDDRNSCVGNVGGIPASSQTDLDHSDVHRGIRKSREGHGRYDLEEGHLDAVDVLTVDHGHHRLDLTPGLVEQLAADGTTVDADALGDVDQMWGAVTSHPQTGGPQQRVDHDGRRSLAVGAGNLDDRAGLLWVAQQVEKGTFPVKAGTDAVLWPTSGQLCHELVMAAQ